MTKLLSTYVLLIFSIETVASELTPITASGVAEFGPETSQAVACEKAVANAKQNALRKQYGENVGQRSVLTCNPDLKKQTGNQCELFENTWSLLNTNGFIKNVELVGEQKIVRREGYSQCIVTAKISIEEYVGNPDYSFETTVRLEQGMNLDPSDKPVVEIKSNRPAYHYVYYWAPFVDSENYYQLFPNAYDQQVNRTENLQIPTNQATRDYHFEVSLPTGMTYSHEYLIVISSKSEIPHPPDKITEVGFFRWLKGFSRDQWTQATLNYRVIGDSAWQT